MTYVPMKCVVSTTKYNVDDMWCPTIQTIQSLDMLRKAPKLNMADLESSETIGALHTLYSMTLTPIGEFVTGIIDVPYSRKIWRGISIGGLASLSKGRQF